MGGSCTTERYPHCPPRPERTNRHRSYQLPTLTHGEEATLSLHSTTGATARCSARITPWLAQLAIATDAARANGCRGGRVPTCRGHNYRAGEGFEVVLESGRLVA